MANITGTIGNDNLYDTSGDDSITALEGNDSVISAGGRDTIFGGDGNDTIGDSTYDYTNATKNTAYGEAGDDFIAVWGYLDGGIGNDSLNASSGHSTLIGGEGNDSISAGDGGNAVSGGEGDDSIMANGVVSGGNGNDWIYGAGQLSGEAGNDVISGSGGATLLGGDGNDTLNTAYSGGDLVDGGIGNDLIRSQDWGNASVIGGDGDDTIEMEGARGTYVMFNDGDDYLLLRYGSYLTSLSGVESISFDDAAFVLSHDTLGNFTQGTAEGDSLTGGVYGDWIDGMDGADTINGTGGNDSIVGGAGNDSLDGAAGNDTLVGNPGDDILDGGDGNDFINDVLGTNTIRGGIGNDTIYGSGTVYGGDGADVLSGDSYSYEADQPTTPDALYGEDGDDVLTGGPNWPSDLGPNTLDGGIGNDRIYGVNGGRDYIIGGAGNDYIDSRNGSDILLGGDGNDTLIASSGSFIDGDRSSLSGGAGNDTLMGNGTLDGGDGDDQITAEGPSQIIGGAGNDTAIFRSNASFFTLAHSGDELLVIRKGYDVSSATRIISGVESLTFSDTTVDVASVIAGAVVIGTAGNDSLTGTAYADYISGLAGNDTVAAGAGDDAVYGGLGADSVNGDTGNDTIGDTQGENTVDGGAGNDSIDGSGLLYGGIGNDTIQLYLGFDGETAPNGAIDGGDGDDYVYGGTDTWSTSIAGGEGNDTVMGAGTLNGGNGNDSIRAWDYTLDDLVLGGAGNDTLHGGTGNNTVDGGDGDDTAYVVNAANRDQVSVINLGGSAGLAFISHDPAYVGNVVPRIDILKNTEHVYLYNNAQVNLSQAGSIIGGTGAGETLSGGAWDDSIVAGDGDDTVSGGTGNDILRGDAGNDQLNGEAGYDYIDGGDGNDTLNGGVGVNTLVGGAGDDLIQGGPGSGVLFGQGGNDTIVADASDNVDGGAGDDFIQLKQYSYSVTGGDGYDTLDLHDFGQALNMGMEVPWGFRDFEYVIASDFNDSIVGGGSANRIAGGKGNDELSGYGGNDTLDGGEGLDTLDGGAGNDIYGVDNAGDQTVETVNMGDDTVIASLSWTLAANVENLVLTGAAVSGTGNELNNAITGTDGANTLSGGGGNDTLDGGLGDDDLIGGTGLDTAVFAGNRADYAVVKTGGIITVTGADGADTLSGVEYLSFDDETVPTSAAPVLTGDLTASIGFGASYVLTAADLGFTDADDGAAAISFIVSNLKGGKVTLDGAAVSSFSASDLAAGKVAFQHGARATDTNGFDVAVTDGVSQTDGINFTVWVSGAAGRVLTGYDSGEAELISLNAAGEQANGETYSWKASADGRYVVFASAATNLVEGTPEDGLQYLYRKDMMTGEIDRVETLADGTLANQAGWVTDISDDGNLVMFASPATNLTTHAGAAKTLVYVKNMTTGEVSVASTLTASTLDVGAFWGQLTGDGATAFFSTWSFDIAGPVDFMLNIYAKSLSDGTVTEVSDFNSPGGWTYYGASLIDATRDGSKLLFSSNAPFHVPDDFNNSADLFVLDVATNTVLIVNAPASGVPLATPDFAEGFLSEDGSKVAFSSAAPGLTAVDPGGVRQVYVKDLTTGAITLISADATGGAGNGTSVYSGFSADGAVAYFTSAADNLVAGDINGKIDLFAYDLSTGGLTRVVAGNGDTSGAAGISQDFLLFSSAASDLIDGDTNGAADAFLLHVSGNDTLTGNTGHDQIFGKGGNDVLRGEAGSDSLDGATGNDTLNGGQRWDTLNGGAGDDVLDGGADNDQMYGGAGNDLYVVDHIGDRVYEGLGQGNDTVKASISYALTADVETLLLTGTGNTAGTGNGLHNAIEGTSGGNVLAGGTGNDSLYGWDGNDNLSGGNDHDRLSGGNGADTLIGGHGNDQIGGGAGADDFVFSGVAVNGHDHVVDFVHGLDRLVFAGADYGFAAGHVLTAAEFTVGAAAIGSGAQFVWNGQKLWWDADGSGAGAAFELALISGGASVTKDDLYFT